MTCFQREPLILASQSASRQAMLNAAGIAFEIVTSGVDEAAIKTEFLGRHAEPHVISHALAVAKTEAVSHLYPDRWVLGGDSVVSVDRHIFSKPASRLDAANHLRAFSGKMMALDSSAVLARGGKMIDSVDDNAHLEVRHLSDMFIENYLDLEWPAIASCVGCFRIEGLGVQLFNRLSGSHFTILGMPLLPVLDRLRTHGVLTA